MKPKSLAQRIFWWMAFVGLVPLLAMAVQGYFWIVREIEEGEKEHLVAVLESRYSGSTRIFEGLQEDFFTASSSHCIRTLCQSHQPPPDQNTPLCHVLDALRSRENYYKSIFIYNDDWEIIAASKITDDILNPPPALRERLEGSNDLIVADELDFTGNEVIAQVGQSFANSGSRVYIVGVLDLYRLASRLTQDDSGLGETGKIYVLSRNGRYIAPPRGSSELLGKKGTGSAGLLSEPGTSVLRYLDWRGVPVLGVSARFPQIDMFLVAEVDEAEVFRLPRHLALSAIVIGLFTLVIVFFISMFSSRSLSLSLRQLAQVAKDISSGNYKERAPAFADRETQEVGEAFNQMLDRIEVSQRLVINTASLAAVGELSSGMAHEMKSPLSSIRINLQALRKKVAGDPVHSELAEISLQQLQRLETMLNELLHYSKPLTLKPEKLSFARLCGEVEQAIGRNVREKGLTLDIDDQLGDVELFMDRELMVRALTGLVDNAIQFSPPGGRITLSARKMEGGKPWFAIQVADEGPGIQERHRERLFQPFFTTRRQGTGLGLTNVRKIVEQHGGTVFAEKNVTRGSVFTIHLPPTEFAA
ncbi:MAG: sensor histidine kinase [Desulfobulbaceae bacterium]|nr:sensor histidine kinase [Desulfobulbaceae bacterium]